MGYKFLKVDKKNLRIYHIEFNNNNANKNYRYIVERRDYMEIGFIGADHFGKRLGIYMKKRGVDIAGYYCQNRKLAAKDSEETNTIAFKEIHDLIQASDILIISIDSVHLLDITKSKEICEVINSEKLFICINTGEASDILKHLENFGCGVYSMKSIIVHKEEIKKSSEFEMITFVLEGNGIGQEKVKQLFKKIENTYFMKMYSQDKL